MGFNESKKAGDIIEEEILKILKKKDKDAFIDNKDEEGNDVINKKWDIYLPNFKYGVEVKGDYKSKDTENLVVEVEMFGRPSALSVTKSRWWVFVEGYRFIWIKPLEIYRFIELNQYKRTHWTGNGDSQPKYAYLIDHEDFVKYCWKHGVVEMIPESHILYYDNFTKR